MIQKMDAYLVPFIQHFPVIRVVALALIILSLIRQDFSIITNALIIALLGKVLILQINFVLNLAPLRIVYHVTAHSLAGHNPIA